MKKIIQKIYKCFNCGEDIRIIKREKGNIYACTYCGREAIEKANKSIILIYKGE